MPTNNGRELSEALTARRPQLETIYFSGYAADVISDHGVLDECVEFVQKPFVRKELLERVRRVLDERT
jgi:FixJ family two-component response regulator